MWHPHAPAQDHSRLSGLPCDVLYGLEFTGTLSGPLAGDVVGLEGAERWAGEAPGGL